MALSSASWRVLAALVLIGGFAVFSYRDKTPPAPVFQATIAQRPAPDSFRGIAWGAALPSVQKLRETALKSCPTIVEQKNFTDTPPCSHMHLATDDLDLFTQRPNVPSIYGVAVSEQLLQWSHRKFWSGNVFIYDYTDAQVQKLRDALVGEYGSPTFINDNLHFSKWQWPEKKIEISLHVNPKALPSIGSDKTPHTSLTLSFEKSD